MPVRDNSRKSTSETTLLGLRILSLILSHRSQTASEIQVKLAELGMERDLRTVQRQLSTLAEEFRLEVDDSSKPYRYKWGRSSVKFTLPNFTPAEALVLSLARSMLKGLLPSKEARELDTVFGHAEGALSTGGGSSSKARAWLDKVRIVPRSQPLLPPLVAADVFERVSEALYEDRVLAIDYEKPFDAIESRRVGPLGIAKQGNNLYLVAYCFRARDVRHFALHRIRSAYVSMDAFVRPVGFKFDFDKYVAAAGFNFSRGEKIRLHFWIEQNHGFHLTETPLSTDQVMRLDEEEGWYKVAATVPDSEVLRQWLAGFGDKMQGVRRMKLKNKSHQPII